MHGPVLSSTAIRALEKQHVAVEPGLMERAGQAAATLALQLCADRKGCVLVLAGPGNNGGDAYVVARLLRKAGREVLVVAEGRRSLPADAEAACEAWEGAGGQTAEEFVGRQWALVIDGLFGIGLKRAPEGRYAEWIERVNGLSCPVLALDVPSGLDADTGTVPGVAVRATHTASFIALKPGLLTADGPDHCGAISVHTLDLPVPESDGQVLGQGHFSVHLKPRMRNSHKGHFGNAGVIGGAPGMVGAAVLAARAALGLGAGRVYVGMLDPHAPGVDLHAPELMMREAGDLHLLCSALAIGPGIGQSDLAQQHVRRGVGFAGALLLDADALTILAESPALQTTLCRREAPTVMTPHPAEAARLMQCTTQSVQSDRVACAVEMARRFRANVVLKGCGSVVAAPDGRWAINTSGHPGMASAGMGDVLSGLTLALMAQHWPASAALAATVHLHGLAADALAAQGVGPVGLSASETIAAARRVFNQWVSG